MKEILLAKKEMVLNACVLIPWQSCVTIAWQAISQKAFHNFKGSHWSVLLKVH